MRLLVLMAAALWMNVAQAGLWDSLAGRWTGTGQVSGMAASIELEFRPALEGRAHHLTFFNRMQGADGKTWPFRAEAFYLCDAERACRGHWYDTRGMILPLRAAASADRLVVEWGDDATERGRTTYRLTGEAALEITDEALGKDGRMSVFGRTMLKRD